MRAFHSNKGITNLQIGIALSLVFLFLFVVAFFLSHHGINRLKTELEKSVRKIQLIQNMRSDLLASAEAEKSSVMANTDEASKSFVEQSMQASENLEKTGLSWEHLWKK